MSSFGFEIFMFGLFNIIGGVFLGSFFTFRERRVRLEELEAVADAAQAVLDLAANQIPDSYTDDLWTELAETLAVRDK